MPQRIQLRRTKGWRMPPGTTKVDRTTRWGNPFVIGEVSPREDTLGGGTPRHLCGVHVQDRAHAIALFREWLQSPSVEALRWRQSVRELRGHNLACWCPPDEPCHADVLLAFANGP